MSTRENIRLIARTPSKVLFITSCALSSFFSRTPDRDFRCYYPCEIILLHIPVRKDKNKQSHVDQ